MMPVAAAGHKAVTDTIKQNSLDWSKPFPVAPSLFVHFELALTQGVWKIVAPHMPPHVSLSFALMHYAAKDSVCRPPKKCASQRTLEQLKRMAK